MLYTVYTPDPTRGPTACMQYSFSSIKELIIWAMERTLQDERKGAPQKPKSVPASVSDEEFKDDLGVYPILRSSIQQSQQSQFIQLVPYNAESDLTPLDIAFSYKSSCTVDHDDQGHNKSVKECKTS
jgi:hypothetical protein